MFHGQGSGVDGRQDRYDWRPGLADPLSGTVKLGKKSDCDVLNEVAAGTLLPGGEILALPKEQIPGDSGVAEAFRY